MCCLGVLLSETCLFVWSGVLWLCVVAESLYLSLLFIGGCMMILEQCPCFSIMNKLKLSAFAAMLTALSGSCAASHGLSFCRFLPDQR